MKLRLPLVALLLAVFGWSQPEAGARGLRLFSQTWGDAVIVTEMTDAGRALPLPTPERPVYFLGRSLGCKFGSLPGDRVPDTKEMTALVTKVLAKQGYIGATRGVREPSLYLVVSWGYLEPRGGDLMRFLGYNPRDDTAAPIFPPGKLGPEVFRRSFRSRTIETILESASEPIYGIIITAFDSESAKTDAPIFCWQTRIGLPARGKSMAAALPTMIMAAGPTIGRETKSPLLQDTDAVREGQVEVGEAEVVGIVEEPAAANDSPAPRR